MLQPLPDTASCCCSPCRPLAAAAALPDRGPDAAAAALADRGLAVDAAHADLVQVDLVQAVLVQANPVPDGGAVPQGRPVTLGAPVGDQHLDYSILFYCYV